jgi:UDP-glucose 6-dehydrogenase
MKISIAGPGYVGLSDATPIQKKYDVSGLFYEN